MKKIIAGIKLSINALLASPKQWVKNTLVRSRNSFRKIATYLKKRKEATKKCAKAYFCFWFSIGDIFLLHVILFMLLVLSTISIKFFAEMSGWTMLQISFFVTLGHLILCSILRVIYIETPSEYLGGIFCEILVVDGKPEVLDRPLWKKGVRYVIEDVIKKFETSSKTNSPNKGIFNSNVTSIYGNTVVSIPLTITMYFTNCFDEIEVFNALYTEQVGEKTLSFDKYVNSLTHIDQELSTPVGQYVRREISCPEFLDRAVEFISFPLPENTFSNVWKVGIYLGEPSFSSHR